MKKSMSILMLFFIVLAQSFSLGKTVFSEDNQTKAPSLSFQVSPNPIGSLQEVSLNVNIDSSFNELPNPSMICFDVPSILIRQSSDFKNQILPDYLNWVSTDDDGTNTHVCYQLDPTGQQYFEFSIQFTSDLLLEGQVLPEYDLSATLNEVTTVKDTVKTNSDNLGEPHFAKFRKFATDPVDNLGLLDLNFPNYNTYELIFNRDFSGEFQNVKIKDQLAAGTKLDTTFSGWKEIPGNKDAVKGLRVYQIDETIPAGQENRQYVTEKFANKIAYDEATGIFDVDLGTVSQSISYVVQYAVEVTDGSLGTYTNTATLERDTNILISKTSTEKIKSNGSGKGFFEKSVDKLELFLPDRLLTYMLKIGGVGYSLPKGTIFFDYLPEGVTFKEVNSKTGDGFELVSIEENKVTFKTTKELTNYSEILYFDVEYQGDIFPQTLNNTAYIQKDTGTYYSNTVKTEVKGNQSVILTKSDADNQKVLAGAHFDLYTKSGDVIKSDLISNTEGIITVEGLDIGAYYFIETRAPEGYILDETPIHFEITESQSEPVHVNKFNKAEIVNLGKVILTKTDAVHTDEKLKGAVFRLQDSTGKSIKENLISSEIGEIVVEGLEPGNYQFVETKAPEGYVLDSTPVNFTIVGNSNEIVTVIKKNRLLDTSTGTNNPNPPGPGEKETSETNIPSIPDEKNKIPALGESLNSIGIFLGIATIIIGLALFFSKKKIK